MLSTGCLPSQLILAHLQYLDGPEIDCDLVFSEGVAVYGAITGEQASHAPVARVLIVCALHRLGRSPLAVLVTLVLCTSLFAKVAFG